MAEDFLEEIYQEARLCCEIRQVVQYAKSHDGIHEVDMGNILLPKLGELCKRYLEQDREKGLELWKHIQTVQDVPDPVLIGDTLERGVLPLVEEYMKQYGSIRTENDEGDYLFESTVSGFLTIKDLKGGRYFHSTIDPMWEARRTAEYIYDPKKAQYSIRGCGLGYLIYQLYDYSYESAVINVFEKDARMVEYARKYGVLDWVPEENLKIVVDEDPTPFLQSALEAGAGMHIFVPELYGEKEDIESILWSLNNEYSTHYKMRRDIAINYWSNLRQDCKMISEFDSSHLNKDFIVVAGGPSVDDNMDFLRENMGKKTLIAVGTVFRKLIQAGIIPDMAAIMDPMPKNYKQVEGLEDQRVPLLLAMEAPWKIAARYQGEKYLIPTENLGEKLELSKNPFEDAWKVGGTVTDLALAAAIRFGAKKIYMVGVDMAYPGGISHAEGTLDKAQKSLENLIPVEGVNGEVVYTDITLNEYREQIEERIANTPQVAWYNMSRIGAKIAGTTQIEE